MPPVADLIVEEPRSARPAVVEHESVRQFPDLVAGHFRAMREVAILLSDEVPFVEQSDLDGGLSIQQQRAGRRRADVLRLQTAIGQRSIAPRVDRLANVMEGAPAY